MAVFVDEPSSIYSQHGLIFPVYPGMNRSSPGFLSATLHAQMPQVAYMRQSQDIGTPLRPRHMVLSLLEPLGCLS